jgi:hypothetical protein
MFFSPSPRSSPRDRGEVVPYADIKDKSTRALLSGHAGEARLSLSQRERIEVRDCFFFAVESAVLQRIIVTAIHCAEDSARNSAGKSSERLPLSLESRAKKFNLA